MPTKENTKAKRIAFIGKFRNLYDEEYIAQSLEMLGCEVRRIPQHYSWIEMREILMAMKPDILLYTKWEPPKEISSFIQGLQRAGTKTVCWIFDLYFDYTREYQVKSKSFFKSDYVFTTDGGHQERFEEHGINHACVRQGIFKEECILLPFKTIENEIIFIGSDNPIYPERSKLVKELNATWYGRKDTNELRGMDLNELYSRSRIVIGDSFPSPHYWSNRVVETLGRGGFLIHKEVPGIKEEFPYLITYNTLADLYLKIDYYSKNEEVRRDNILRNHKYVLENYTMDKKCKELLQCLKQ